jgi:hypothetical protein
MRNFMRLRNDVGITLELAQAFGRVRSPVFMSRYHRLQ